MGNTVQELDPLQLKDWLDEGDVLLIDVREKMEYAPEHIQGAHHLPTSSFNADKVPEADGRRVVFYCQSGVRSFNAARRWLEIQDGEKAQAYNLQGGIAAWKDFGLSTRVDTGASAEVQRQVYVIVGIMILLSSLLTAFLSIHFIWMTGIIGTMLVFSGLTGICRLQILLSMMPWNRH